MLIGIPYFLLAPADAQMNDAVRSQDHRGGGRGGPASSMGGMSQSIGGTPGFSHGSLPSTPGMHMRLTPLPRPELGPRIMGRRLSTDDVSIHLSRGLLNKCGKELCSVISYLPVALVQ